MSILRHLLLPAVLATTLLPSASPARAQVTLNESGFSCVRLSGDYSKQVELGVGPDTCLYYGSPEGLRRRCAPTDTGTVCDPTLTFPVGIAFSKTGSFGNFMYVSDNNVGDIHRSAGCATTSLFATVASPGSIAFPPSGSAYGDYLYACEAFNGPIYRVSSAGVVSTWLDFPTTYMKFGPGGTWGTGLYANDYTSMASPGLSRVSSAGVATPFATGFVFPEGFDWGFNGDMFVTDLTGNAIYRVKSTGAMTLFATLAYPADVAYRAGKDELYVVSYNGGLYRIRRVGAAGVDDGRLVDEAPSVSPNPARGACALRFVQHESGLARASVFDAQGRMVRRLPEAWRPAGAHTLTWDGRDDEGLPVRAGAYFMRVLSGGQARSAGVVILR